MKRKITKKSKKLSRSAKREAYVTKATKLLKSRAKNHREFKSYLESAIEYLAWDIICIPMEDDVESDGLSINDVVYAAIDRVADSYLKSIRR